MANEELKTMVNQILKHPSCESPKGSRLEDLWTKVKQAKLNQKEINRNEYRREQSIKALNLEKDDMYVQLLLPFKYERVISATKTHYKGKIEYICKYENCEKSFMKACNFLDHVRMHEEVKPYEWVKCDVAFVQSCNLIKHKKLHCEDSLRQKRFHCLVWEKSFTDKYSLKVSHQLMRQTTFYNFFRLIVRDSYLAIY